MAKKTFEFNNDCLINGVQYKCRTCFDPGRVIHSLTEEFSNQKTWHEILKEVAQSQTNYDEFLPKTVCNKCLEKLKVSYGFLQQIQTVNKKYSELLAEDEVSNKVDNSTDCLAEFAITMPLDEIKLEEEMVVAYDINMSKEKLEDGDDTQFDNEDHDDPFNETYDGNYNPEFESSSSDESDNEAPCSSSSATIGNVSLRSRNKKIPQDAVIEKIDDNCYMCVLCKKKLTFLKNCRRHVKNMHYSQIDWTAKIPTTTIILKKNIQNKPDDVNSDNDDDLLVQQQPKDVKLKKKIQQQPKDVNLKTKHTEDAVEIVDDLLIYKNTKYSEFGDRIYSKPTTWRLVECKLCSTTFKTCKALREHLENHSDVDTLHALQLTDYAIQHLFPNENNINIIKDTIRHDISKKQWFQYYTVLNEHFYEMSISDTEVEELEDENSERANKYKCTLCAKEFSYKYQLYPHIIRKCQNKQNLFNCEHCKLGFNSIKMYRQHLQTHCNNKYKTLLCENCPGKFVWPENKNKHNCVRRQQENYQHNEIQHNKTRESSNDGRLFLTAAGPSATAVLINKNCFEIEQVSASDLDKIPAAASNTIFNNVSNESISDIRSRTETGLESTTCNQPTPETETKFFCCFCGVNFSNTLKLKVHTMTRHTGRTTFDCSLCEMTFMTETALETHRLVHHAADHPFKCKFCEKSFERRVQLDSHKRSHRERSHSCTFCEKSFKSSYKLKRHMPRHKGKTTFDCSHCEMTFPTETELETHRLTDHVAEHPFKCMICEKSFERKTQLQDHKRFHKEKIHYCTVCHKSFKQATKLKIHLVTHSDEKPFKCDICSKSFACSLYLKNHRIALGHTELWSIPENTDDICNSESVQNSEEPIRNRPLCYVCGLYMSKHSSFREHMKIHTGEKPHQCDICEMAFTRKFDLITHRRTHTNERPFKCPHCEKTFIDNQKLKMHIRVHTGERPYKCTFCDKSFSISQRLKLHLRIHTGEKPYKCDVCDEYFACRPYLKKHRIAKGHFVEKE